MANFCPECATQLNHRGWCKCGWRQPPLIEEKRESAEFNKAAYEAFHTVRAKRSLVLKGLGQFPGEDDHVYAMRLRQWCRDLIRKNKGLRATIIEVYEPGANG